MPRDFSPPQCSRGMSAIDRGPGSVARRTSRRAGAPHPAAGPTYPRSRSRSPRRHAFPAAHARLRPSCPDAGWQPAPMSASRQSSTTSRLARVMSSERPSVSSVLTTCEAASITCSQLSSTSSSDRFRSQFASTSMGSWPGTSRIPRVAAIVRAIAPPSATGASSTRQTPPRKGTVSDSASCAAASSARRVLPTLPVPVIVTRRALATACCRRASSLTRPTHGVSGGVRVVASRTARHSRERLRWQQWRLCWRRRPITSPD